MLPIIDRVARHGSAVAVRDGLGSAVAVRDGLGSAVAVRDGLGSAVAVRDGMGTTTYTSLLDRSAALAAALLGGRGDLAGERIGILVEPDAAFVAALWGVWRAGGIAVPLSLHATADELAHVVADAGIGTALADDHLTASRQDVFARRGMRLLDPRRAAAPATPLPDVDPTRPGLMLFTSGTTARPKGVVTTHRCIQAQIESLVAAWRWSSADRIPLFLPLHHVHGLINVVSCAAWAGATVTALGKFDPAEVSAAVAADEFTLFMAVPTIFVRLLEALDGLAAPDRARVAAGFGRLRLVVSGSAALPASVFERFATITGQRILERYGMTEIGMALSNPYDGPRRPGHVGGPLPGVAVRLWSDASRGAPPPGEPGEIQVRGDTVFAGYWGQPEATAAAFVDGWFRTGDVAVIEEGSYRILGRSSVDIIKSGGYKLSALEIEAALLDCPAIADCAVVGLPDDTWGETVAAAVVLRAGTELSLEAVRDWARQRLSPYKLPRALVCVAALPRNAMGKVTKPAVRELFDAT